LIVAAKRLWLTDETDKQMGYALFKIMLLDTFDFLSIKFGSKDKYLETVYEVATKANLDLNDIEL
jgi:hypothetical protein